MKIKRKSLAVLTLSLILAAAGLSSDAASNDLIRLAESRYWHLLLHYKGTKSEVRADSDFFLSDRGHMDPLAELEADLKAFAQGPTFEVGYFQQHPQCAFPERYRFIKEQLKLDQIDIPCPEWRQWKANFRPRSLSVVYAAPYLGNIASMFGHTFLRINTNQNQLLDIGISFDAKVGSNPGLGYIFRGLFGGYPGLFSQQSYYDKIKTYSHLESRDLWEYELNLTPAQVERLIDHLWELQNADFNYYFTNGNCSYHLLSLLEVAEPAWHLRDNFHVHAIPLETLRQVTRQKQAVRGVQVRPALIHELKNLLGQMNLSERQAFFDLRQRKQEPDQNVPSSLLDALLLDSQLNGQMPDRKILSLRAQKKESRALPSILPATASRPDFGHRPSKLNLWASFRRRQEEYGLGWRLALTDFLDADQGYIPFSSLVLGEIQLGYRPSDRSFFLQDLILADVVNLDPIDSLRFQPSWRISAGVTRSEDRFKFDQTLARLRAGLGLSFFLWRERLLTYTFLNAQAESGRWGPSLEGGGKLKLNANWGLIMSGEKFLLNSFGESQFKEWTLGTLAAAYSFRRSEVRVNLKQWLYAGADQLEGNVNWAWYY